MQARDERAAALEPEIEVDDNGVDLTLIRWSLSLTPEQRLQECQHWIDTLALVRRVDEPSDATA